MVKGRRDDHATLRVPQELCYRYTSKSTGTWIEVRLPGGDDDEWDSFMVKPDQVFYDHANPDKYNIIESLNRDTQIVVSRKIKKGSSQSIVPDSERYYDPIGLLLEFKDCN